MDNQQSDLFSETGQITASLDRKGRCCGRKPIEYKGGSIHSPEGGSIQIL